MELDVDTLLSQKYSGESESAAAVRPTSNITPETLPACRTFTVKASSLWMIFDKALQMFCFCSSR